MQKILYGSEARAAIKRGIDKSADAIKLTLGPVGMSMVIDQGLSYPTITDDGVTGARLIHLEDPFEDVGAKLIREIAVKANDQAGDGTTTATVLAQAMAEEAFRIIDQNPEKVAEVRKGLAVALADAKKQLDAMARPVEGREDIRRVAEISSLDSEVAEAIAEAIDTLGRNATIVVEEGSKPGLSIETVNGMRFPTGLLNGFFVTNHERMEGEAKEPKVIVTDKKITSAEQMGKLLERLLLNKVVNFVLVADDYAPDAVATLLTNQQRGAYACLAIQAPYAGMRRKDALDDLAALCGGSVISEALGHRFEDFPAECIGQCEKVTATKSHATFVGGPGDVQERVRGLEGELEAAGSPADREALTERLAGLTGGIGVIRVSAFSDTELRARRYKIEDALNATRASIEEGIVPGGGAALFSIGLSNGNEIFRKGLAAPFNQMERNAGVITTEYIGTPDGCVDFLTGEVVNAFEAGIIDPVKVVKSSLESAVSVVSTALSAGCLIVEFPDKKE